MLRICGSYIKRLLYLIFLISFSLLKGFSKVISSYRMTPKDQVSKSWPTSSYKKNSGAAYRSVATLVLADVNWISLVVPRSPILHTYLRTKSSELVLVVLVGAVFINMFSGLRSLWTKPLWWMNHRPLQISKNIRSRTRLSLRFMRNPDDIYR